MNKGRTIWIRLGLGISFLLVFLGAFVFFSPMLIDQETVRGWVMAYISKGMEGRVETQKIDLSFFPQPHVTLHRAKIAIPGNMNMTIKSESLTVYPFLRPLLRGRINIRRINAETPVVSAEIPETAGMEASNNLYREETRIAVLSSLGFISQHMPGLTIGISRGEVHLLFDGQPVVCLMDVRGEIRSTAHHLKVNFSCSPEAGKFFSLDGRIELRDLNAEGHIRLEGFQPQKAAVLFPVFSQTVGDFHHHEGVNFRMAGPGNLRGDDR